MHGREGISLNLRTLFVASLSALFLAACGGSGNPITLEGEWRIKSERKIVAFYGASTNQTAAQLREATRERARSLLEDWDRVTIVILYDPTYARRLSAPKIQQAIAKIGVMPGPAEWLYGSERFRGGGYWSGSKENPDGKWSFVPFRDVKAATPDRRR